MSHRVDIQKAQEPVFPDRCVNCGTASPGESMSIKGALSGNTPLREDVFKRWRAEVPCCRGCQGAVRRHRFIAKLLFGASVVAALFLLLIIVTIWPGITDSWLIYVAILSSVAIPGAIVQSIHVPQIELTPSDERLIFEFKNHDFASQFAELNESKVV